MHKLQLEVEEIIIGFETRFRGVQRNGLRVLESSLANMDGDVNTEYDTEVPQSPEVTILPIPGHDPNTALPILVSEIPVVGRGKVEIEEALERAKIFLDGKHEDVAEADQSASRLDPSSASAPHVEL